MSEVKDIEFLEHIVKSIVDNPDAVKVTRDVDERGVLISLDVDAKDMGMIIGRQGSTAKAIRTLLRVVGARNDSRVNLKINEPEGSNRPAPSKSEEGQEESADRSIDDIVGDIN